jgi:Amt family ammonium transporter
MLHASNRRRRRLAPLAIALTVLCGLSSAGHLFAQTPPPAAPVAAPAPDPVADPSGTATGDKTTVSDAGGNAFVPPSPSESDDAKSKADKAKALSDYNAQAAKEPLAVKLADGVGHVKVATNMAWVLNTGYLVLFMQAGFALLTTGLVRKKNAGHLMMLNFAAYVIAFIGYYLVGFALMYGAAAVNGAGPLGLGGTPTLNHALLGSGAHIFLGKTGILLMGPAYDAGVFGLMMFEVVFMETAGYIIVGAICERITFWAFILCELFIGAILYPVFGCWAWGGGWMSQLGAAHGMAHGYVDFAGSTVVHGVGGFAAMALAVILGPRIGKYDRKGRPVAFPGHNLVFVVTGTFILLFGWMGFNPGSTLQATDLRISIIAVNTNLAAVFGSAAALAFWTIKFKKPDVSMACNGMLAGLVAITAPCAFVNPVCACVIGILAGLVVCVGVLFNERVLKVDDPCGAISVHGYCGYLGGICVGIFADGKYGQGWNNAGVTTYLGTTGAKLMGVTGLLFGDARQFVTQLIGATIMVAWAFGATFVVFKLVNAIRPIRVSAEAELAGLDVPEFGVLAYPEDEYPTSTVEHEQVRMGHGLRPSEQPAG